MNTIYTTQYCGWCKRANAVLDQRGIAYREVDVTEDRELQKEMVQRTGRQSVPQIFLDDEHIGGYDDLISYFSAEKAVVNS
jgi:GrxC family glutaredoxin